MREITALGSNPPTIPNITFASSGSGLAYAATPGGPAAAGTVTTGSLPGPIALKRVYTLDATARTAGSGEYTRGAAWKQWRSPCSSSACSRTWTSSFSAADEFDFGGRVHTNSNLFLAQGGASGDSLILRDKVTALPRDRPAAPVERRIHRHVGAAPAPSAMAKAPGSFRSLDRTEGSVVDGPTGAKKSLVDDACR